MQTAALPLGYEAEHASLRDFAELHHVAPRLMAAEASATNALTEGDARLSLAVRARPEKPRRGPRNPTRPPRSRLDRGNRQRMIRGRIYYFGNRARRVDGKLVRVEGHRREAAPK